MSLRHHFPLNGNANPSLGGVSPATVHPNVSWVAGRSGQAASFNGVDTYIEYPNGHQFMYPKLSVAYWTYRRSPQGGEVYSCEFVVNGSFYLRHEPTDGNIDVKVWTDVDGNSGNLDFGPLPYDQWNHLVGEFDGEYAYVWANGEYRGRMAHQGTISNSGNPLRFSSRNGPGSHVIDGMLQDVRVYDHLLNQIEVDVLSGNRTDTELVRRILHQNQRVKDLRLNGQSINVPLLGL